MIKQIKLSLWDALSYYVTGFAILLSLYLHGLAKGVEPDFENTVSKGALIGIAGILLPYFLGLLYEPVANFVGDKLRKGLPVRIKKLFGWTDTPGVRKDAVLEDLVKETLPVEIRDKVDVYHWCKDYLVQSGADTPYMVFLAKFGFYRNMGCLFLMNAMGVLLLHWKNWQSASLACTCFCVLAVIYYRRSASFYDHLSSSMYRNYLVAVKGNVVKTGKRVDRNEEERETEDE